MHDNDTELIFVPYGQYLWFLDQDGHWFECMDWGGTFWDAPLFRDMTIEVMRTLDRERKGRDA